MNVRGVCYEDSIYRKDAEGLAERWGVPSFDGNASLTLRKKERIRFFQDAVGTDEPSLLFVYTAKNGSLSLQTVSHPGGDLSIAADFCGASVNYRRERGGGRGEMLARAVGIRSRFCPRVLDLTAGLGSDAFVFASLGCSVRLVERVPAIYELLAAGVSRAMVYATEEDSTLLPILRRMQVELAEAANVLKGLNEDDRPDVIYLDPMFPAKKKSALVKKEMQVFQSLVGPDTDTETLLEAAIQSALNRVVVKRPKNAKPIGGRKPSHIIAGKTNRFDVYLS